MDSQTEKLNFVFVLGGKSKVAFSIENILTKFIKKSKTGSIYIVYTKLRYNMVAAYL